MIVWNKTYEVLREFAIRLRNEYQDKLIQDNKIATGELLNSVDYVIEKNDRAISVSLKLEDYWKWVEEGRKPGKFPPPDAILSWLRVKPIIPDERTGRIPDERQLAYLIGRKIATDGIEPGYQLRYTKERLFREFENRIEEAITQDITENITIIFSEF